LPSGGQNASVTALPALSNCLRTPMSPHRRAGRPNDEATQRAEVGSARCYAATGQCCGAGSELGPSRAQRRDPPHTHNPIAWLQCIPTCAMPYSAAHCWTKLGLLQPPS
jgi:hypothetical protein